MHGWLRIRVRAVAGVLAVALLGAVACGDDDGTGPDDLLSPFVGSWSASSMLFTGIDDPSLSVEATDFGVTFSMTVEADGGWSMVQTHPDEGTDSDTGVLVVESSTRLRIESPSGDEPFRASYQFSNGNGTLTITALQPEMVDVDRDGVDEEAEMTIVLQKQG